ncbi:MAG TPA: hypothetical protein VFZ17_06975, partial [Acidimicrobiia bacterium]|nr:hypothetical protein [Acidimicrobiia bacterium]
DRLALTARVGPPLQLEWVEGDGRACVRISGDPSGVITEYAAMAPDELARALPVFASELVDDDDGRRVPAVLVNHLQPMVGEYRLDDHGITFVPRFPFLAGRSYTVLVGGLGAGAPLSIELPAIAEGPATTVAAIHPSDAVVPRNLLRCYVQFSAPMSEGDAARCVRLVDDTGDPIPGALLEMEPELWDPRRRRLTVLLDPGRIKRGLAPHREAGYPLREGARFGLVVDGAMRDARGVPLAATARRDYDVSPDVRGRVDPNDWRLTPPRIGTRMPLVVDFDRSLDRALLEHCLAVVRDSGVVRGSAGVRDGERSWTFVPDAPWPDVEHHLVIDPMLEDVCGNSVLRVFDRELGAAEQDPITATVVTRALRPV